MADELEFKAIKLNLCETFNELGQTWGDIHHSSIVITVAERTDSDTFSAWLLESKLTLTVNRLLWKNWPNVEAQKPHYAESIEGGWADPAMTYYKATDSTGAVLGFLALSKKQAAPADKAEKVTDCPEVMNEHVFRGVMKAVADICKVTDIEHRYEITYICVDPSARKRGVGKQLVDFVKQQASLEKMPLSLTAEPQGYDFWMKQNFVETARAGFDLSQWAPKDSGFGYFGLVGMRWEPEA